MRFWSIYAQNRILHAICVRAMMFSFFVIFLNFFCASPDIRREDTVPLIFLAKPSDECLVVGVFVVVAVWTIC